MLFSHIADGNLLSVAIHNGYAKQFLRQENTLGVVAKCPVAEVREERFRFIEPVMNRQIVFCSSAEFPRAALCMSERVGHNLYLICGGRVILKAIITLNRHLTRRHIKDNVPETPA